MGPVARTAPSTHSPAADLNVAVGVTLAAVALVIWRVSGGASVFEGKASWLFGVWIESAALALTVAGTMRILAVRDGRAHESFFGGNRMLIGAMLPLAFLMNWAVGSTRSAPPIPGSLQARLEVLNKVADACNRTANDRASCGACCEGKMSFSTVCECLVPRYCQQGDKNPDACRTCCRREDGKELPSELIPNLGCVCNPDESLYE